MFNPEPDPREWRSSFLVKDRKLRPYSSTGFSASIAHDRYQAKYFDGQPDGKIEVVSRETKRIQAIMSDEDN